MKKLVIITGTHKGIGRSLTETFLKTGNYIVWGISRHNALENPDFKFIPSDLSETNFCENLPVSLPDSPEYVLINNAGIIEPIQPVHLTSARQLKKIYNVNILSVHLLCGWFLRSTSGRKVRKTIVNISSGAARYPVVHWSAYCATKAALDMLSECLVLEYPDVKVYSLAPGMVDTSMQEFIRSHSKDDFPDVDRFKAAYENNLLNHTQFVSNKILTLINDRNTDLPVKISIKDIP